MLQQLKRDTPLHFPRNAEYIGLKPTAKEIAAIGEAIAAEWFRTTQRHVLLERNWRSGRFGEIDLILRHPDGLLIFAEVKTRQMWRDRAGFIDYGFDAINWSKRRKLLILAQSYLARNPRYGPSYQCDAVLVTYEKIDVTEHELVVHGPMILHIPCAFDSI
jgi:Holliday junction resolvase-like predicted endonuclease